MTDSKLTRLFTNVTVCAILAATLPPILAQTPAPVAPTAQSESAQTASQARIPFNAAMPKSHNPFSAYIPNTVPKPELQNSPRLESLVREGKLNLSLRDAIYLALENNLDLAIARYNLPIADTDILRTHGGGIFRGVNAGVVQGTPGGGVGGLGSGAPGAGAGGTSAGAGGAGAGAAGQVSSTLGTGTAVSSYDPQINGNIGIEHLTSPLSNLQLYGVPGLQLNTTSSDLTFSQAFPTGTMVSFDLANNRQTTNSIFSNLNPALNSQYRFNFRQDLLAGFGFGPNLRYLRIAKNNKKISDIAFRDQVIATVTQISNIYWDLVSAYQQERVNEQSLKFAEQSYENAKKQFELEAIPEMDVMKAEAEVSRRDQEMTVARSNLQLQESLLKNALTRAADPTLDEMPVVPTDAIDTATTAEQTPLTSFIERALATRPELLESDIDLKNREISRKAARNAVLPTVALVGFYGGAGLAGQLNPAFQGGPNSSTVPPDFGGAIGNAFNNSSPDYFVGFNLNIPIRNRVNKADQYRSELEFRQSELRREQLRKQIRIEVRNALYTLQQSASRVQSAKKARDLAAKTFDIMQKEQQLGAGSSFQTLTSQRDLALAELDFVTAMTTYQKARVELYRATGSTLEKNEIRLDDAINGTISATP
jgi:outer membrane protein TolC